MNLILQNEEKYLQLLFAQRLTYSSAKRWANAALVVSIAYPVCVWAFGSYIPDSAYWEGFIGLVSLVLGVITKGLVDHKIKKAALFQEEFDQEVLGLPKNEGLTGNFNLGDERIGIVGSQAIPSCLKNWYTLDAQKLADSGVGAMLCIRENVLWDLELKKLFLGIIKIAFVCVIVLLVAYGFYMGDGYSVRDWALKIVSPCSYFFMILYGQYQGFSNVARNQEALMKEIENEIKISREQRKIPFIASGRLRLMQDTVFEIRKSNTLVPDWLYHFLRKKHQDRTLRGTKEIIEDLLNFEK